MDGIFPWPAVRDDRNLHGPTSVAVPGQVAGLGEAHRRWGRLPWDALLEPSVALAKDGLCVDWYAILLIGHAARRISDFPETARLFLPGGYPPAASNRPDSVPRLRNDRLADTLDTLRREGPASLAIGDIGATLASDVERVGGWLRREDLERFRPDCSPALRIPFRRATVHAMRGLSGGPTLARALGDYVRLIGEEPADSPDAAFFLSVIQSLRNAFRHRLEHMGHSGESAPASDESDPAPCTSHLSVIDRDGMAVAVTQTLLSVFGSAVVSPGTGVLLNNGIYWFDPRPGGPNSLAPDKRCLANMCPIVVERADGSVLSLGASGGRRIIPAVMQTALFQVECGTSLEEALHCPRIDADGNRVVADSRLDREVVAALGDAVPLVEKPNAVYPAWFANVSAAEWRDGRATGGVQPSMPWGEAIAP